MSDPETAKGMVMEAASNPAIVAWASVATTAVGAMSAVSIINGVMATVSMIAGVIVTLLLGRVHWMKYKILKRTYDRPDADLPKDL